MLYNRHAECLLLYMAVCKKALINYLVEVSGNFLWRTPVLEVHNSTIYLNIGQGFLVSSFTDADKSFCEGIGGPIEEISVRGIITLEYKTVISCLRFMLL